MSRGNEKGVTLLFFVIFYKKVLTGMTKCATVLSAENKAGKAVLVIKNYLDCKEDAILNYSVNVKQKMDVCPCQ